MNWVLQILLIMALVTSWDDNTNKSTLISVALFCALVSACTPS